MRFRTGSIVLTGVFPLLAGCDVFASGSCTIDPKDRPVEVLSQPEVQEASEEEANVIVQVTSSSESPARTSIHFGGDLAFDVEIPADPAQCAHQPIYAFSYDLDPGGVTMTAVTNGEEHVETTKVSTAPIWLVVQVQDGFATSVRVYQREPQWG